MPSDDFPPDALKRLYALEDSSISPVPAALAKLGSALPLTSALIKVFEWVKGRFAGDAQERLNLLLETLITEARKQDEKIKQLFEAQDSRLDAAKDLLVDAARKAVNIRAKERVKRIGFILANGIAEPEIDSDEIEEMMRVAMELSDRDVLLLKRLVEAEGEQVASKGRISRWEAHTKWPWGESLNSEVESVFSKLESYGLVARIAPPNNLNITADFQSRFVLLRKGLRFVTLAREMT